MPVEQGENRRKNSKLIAARERRVMSDGGPMQPQDVADEMNVFLWAEYQKDPRSPKPTVLDHRFVLAYEAGRYWWPSAHYRAAFRHVLRAATDAELGFTPKRRRRSGLQRGNELEEADASSRAHVPAVGDTEPRPRDVDGSRRRVVVGLASPAIAALIGAVLRPFIGDQPNSSTKPAAPGALTAALSEVRRAYQHSRYGAAVVALPDLLANVQRVRADIEGQQVAALEAEAYQVASGLLLKCGEPALAAIAAERCRTAAERSEDELAIACGARAFAHCLMASGHASEGAELAVNFADRLAAHVSMRTPEALSVYGALLLRGAIAAARKEDRDQAYDLLDSAERAADLVGADLNLRWTAFGPANVLAHRVAVAVDLGDAGSAVAYAKKIEMATLELPERKAMVLLDTARALTQWGKLERAFDAIRQAERFAPEEVRRRPSVHQMIVELSQRSPAPLQRQIQAYAASVRASA
jgi:hypothetical protein